MRIKVDFPEPFAPITAVMDPCLEVRLTSRTTNGPVA
jgi:hypothetical protein